MKHNKDKTLATLSISGVERKALDMIDAAVASGRYRSRSHFVCEALKHFAKQEARK